MIELKQALKEINQMDYRDNNGTFSIVFITCNRAKKEGGEEVQLLKACRCGLPPNCNSQEMRGIRCQETGKKYAVHNRLIYTFNGKSIYWT